MLHETVAADNVENTDIVALFIEEHLSLHEIGTAFDE